MSAALTAPALAVSAAGRLRERLMMTDIYASGPGKKSVSRPSTDQRTSYGGFFPGCHLDDFAVSQRTVEHAAATTIRSPTTGSMVAPLHQVATPSRTAESDRRCVTTSSVSVILEARGRARSTERCGTFVTPGTKVLKTADQ